MTRVNYRRGVLVNGRTIRHLRTTAGLRQDVVASDVGMSGSFLCDLEAGRRQVVHPSTVARLAARLDVDPWVITQDPQYRAAETPVSAAA